MCVCTLLFCLLVCALLLLSAPFCFCLHPFVSVSALFSVCTLFHFTHDDFSFRKGHIKSDFLSIHHYVSVHFYSVCLLVRALLFLSAPFCFCLRPFVSVHTLFSACTLFHFTHHDFSFRNGHIKSDFLSIYHMCLHTFILSVFLSVPFCLCPLPFVSVCTLLFLSILVCALCFCPRPFVSVCTLLFLSILVCALCFCPRPFVSVCTLLFLCAPFSLSALFFTLLMMIFLLEKDTLSQIF